MTIPNLSSLCYWSVVSLVESSRCFGCTEMSNDSCPYKCYEKFDPNRYYGLRRYTPQTKGTSEVAEIQQRGEKQSVQYSRASGVPPQPAEGSRMNEKDAGDVAKPSPVLNISQEDKGLYSGMGEI